MENFLNLVVASRIDENFITKFRFVKKRKIGYYFGRNNYGNVSRREEDYYTYDPGLDVETLVSPSLAKDRRAQEHIHGAAIPSQAIQTSDSDYSGSLVQFPQGFRPGVRCEQRRRWFVNHVKMFRPRRERANIRFRWKWIA